MTTECVDNELESLRMDAVRRYDILDTPPDRSFDRVTALAARTCGTPIAIVTIVDTDRIWFKSRHGLEVDQIDRDPGLCASAIMHDEPWIVEDASNDPRTLANPLVAGEMGVQFYLGVPLTTHDGYNLGTLCVLDFKARVATDRHILDLTDLAAIVVDELELRRAARQVLVADEQQRRNTERVARAFQASLLPDGLPEIDRVDLAARYLPARGERVGGDFYDAVTTENGVVLLIGDVAGHGPEAAALTAMARHTGLTLTTSEASPARALSGLNRAIQHRQTKDADPRFCTMAIVRLEHHGDGWMATLSLGGHPQPWLIRSDGTVAGVGEPGTLLGWRDDAVYVDATVEIRSGDTLVLYTDGLTDAPPDSPTVTPDQLPALIAQTTNDSADVIADILIETITERSLLPRDDVAILVAQFN